MDGCKGGKPLTKILREGVLGAVVVLVVAAWVAKPVSAIAPVEAAWWTWGDNSSTPLDKMTWETGAVAVAARGVDSTLTATPQ